MLAVTWAAIGGLPLLAPPHGTAESPALGWVLFVASAGHLTATAALFGFADVRQQARASTGRMVLLPAAAVAGCALLAAALPARWLSLLLLGIFAWQFDHFQRQNLGIVALTARQARIPGPGPRERRSVRLASSAGIAALVTHPSLIGVTAPAFQAVRLTGLALSVALLTAAFATAAFSVAGRGGDRSTAFALTLGSAVLFPLPLLLGSSPYTALAGLTVAHGVQYLVLVGQVVAGPRTAARAPVLVGTAAAVLLAAAGVNALSHLHRGGGFAHLGYGAYLGLLAGHIVADGRLWRLRDAGVRRFLSARLPVLV